MILNSFIRSEFGLKPVKVEVALTPGLSQISILGCADPSIKESSKRIISALRHNGFRIPPGRQVLVNLFPNDLKKKSQGLDLAIALGILLESEQIDKELIEVEESYIYGSLSLKGEIEAPRDLTLLSYQKFASSVYTGINSENFRFQTLEIKDLGSLENIQKKTKKEKVFKMRTPEIHNDIFLSEKMARLMALVAVGEHPILLAGASGLGKTTFVENAVLLLRKPDEISFLEAKKYWMFTGRELHWRPICQPHHSITPQAMIGGGSPPRFGEVSLAHGGALILDELLEFHPQVQGALREPMEKGTIQVVRVQGRKKFPADSIVLATTNLCKCGQFHPNQPYKCRCSSLSLRKYMDRLTGPFLDRFCIFYLMASNYEERKISLRDIKSKVDQAIQFAQQKRKQNQVNQKLPLKEIMQNLNPKIMKELIPTSSSMRRKLSLFRVARTIADMEVSLTIEQEHLEEAQKWTYRDMHRLQSFRFQDY